MSASPLETSARRPDGARGGFHGRHGQARRRPLRYRQRHRPRHTAARRSAPDVVAASATTAPAPEAVGLHRPRGAAAPSGASRTMKAGRGRLPTRQQASLQRRQPRPSTSPPSPSPPPRPDHVRCRVSFRLVRNRPVDPTSTVAAAPMGSPPASPIPPSLAMTARAYRRGCDPVDGIRRRPAPGTPDRDARTTGRSSWSPHPYRPDRDVGGNVAGSWLSATVTEGRAGRGLNACSGGRPMSRPAEAGRERGRARRRRGARAWGTGCGKRTPQRRGRRGTARAAGSPHGEHRMPRRRRGSERWSGDGEGDHDLVIHRRFGTGRAARLRGWYALCR
jgi:hypothetical protein